MTEKLNLDQDSISNFALFEIGDDGVGKWSMLCFCPLTWRSGFSEYVRLALLVGSVSLSDMWL